MFRYTTSLVILLFFANNILVAQQQPLYSQFDNNKYLFNPAVAGSDVITTIHFNAYEQWVGFKGAPKFHVVSMDSKIFRKNRRPNRNIRKKLKLKLPENVGLGVQVFNEKYGPLSQTGFMGTYAYHMKMGDNQFSFGLSSVLSNFGLKASDVVLADEEPDQLVEGDKTRRWIVDFDFGIFFKGYNYYAGYSIHHLSQSNMQWGGSTDYDYRLGRMHYLMGGYSYEINKGLTIDGSTLIKLSENQKNQLDINIKSIFSGKYWGGLSYKTSKTMSIFGGLQYDRYIFGYSFDYSLSAIRKESYGSHEIYITVRLGSDASRYKWLNTY